MRSTYSGSWIILTSFGSSSGLSTLVLICRQWPAGRCQASICSIEFSAASRPGLQMTSCSPWAYDSFGIRERMSFCWGNFFVGGLEMASKRNAAISTPVSSFFQILGEIDRAFKRPSGHGGRAGR